VGLGAEPAAATRRRATAHQVGPPCSALTCPQLGHTLPFRRRSIAAVPSHADAYRHPSPTRWSVGTPRALRLAFVRRGAGR